MDFVDILLFVVCSIIILVIVLQPLARLICPLRITDETLKRAKEKVRKDDIRAENYARKYHDYWLW